MSLRLLPQPVTVSYLFLALTLCFVRPQQDATKQANNDTNRFLLLLVLFLVWANFDSWSVLGLGTVGLVWLGRLLDATGSRVKEARSQESSGLFLLSLRLVGYFCLLAAVCLVNPFNLGASVPELTSLAFTASPKVSHLSGQVTSPLERAYFAGLGLTPAGLAYFLLLGLGALSFAMNLALALLYKVRSWSWPKGAAITHIWPVLSD